MKGAWSLVFALLHPSMCQFAMICEQMIKTLHNDCVQGHLHKTFPEKFGKHVNLENHQRSFPFEMVPLLVPLRGVQPGKLHNNGGYFGFASR